MSEPDDSTELSDLITHIDRSQFDPDESDRIDRAMQSVFTDTMASLEVPTDDEERANSIMSNAITDLMTRCFLSGMAYQYEYGMSNPDANDANQQFPTGVTIPPVGITEEMAAAMVLGLMGNNGVTLKLVVDRGQE
jgi:hypothetical protein